MVTTQLQVMIYIGSRQFVSCSVVVPVPAIVTKSQQQLGSILPYLPLPLALTTALSSVTSQGARISSSTISSSLASEPVHSGAIVHRPTHRELHNSSNGLSTNALVPRTPGTSDCQSLELIDSPADSPSSTACIKISLKPKALGFLGLGFSRSNTSHSHLRGLTDGNGYSNGIALPRIVSVLFTFPFPPYDQDFPMTVQVTGTFDDWQRDSTILTKNEEEGRFEAKVQVHLERLPLFCIGKDGFSEQRQRKILYKFVIDGRSWVTDPAQLLERDYEGNLNNVMFLEDLATEEEEEEEEGKSGQGKAEKDNDSISDQYVTMEMAPSLPSPMEVVAVAEESQSQIEIQPESKESQDQIPLLDEESIANSLVVQNQKNDGDYGVATVREESANIIIDHPKDTPASTEGEPSPPKDISEDTIDTTSVFEALPENIINTTPAFENLPEDIIDTTLAFKDFSGDIIDLAPILESLNHAIDHNSRLEPTKAFSYHIIASTKFADSTPSSTHSPSKTSSSSSSNADSSSTLHIIPVLHHQETSTSSHLHPLENKIFGSKLCNGNNTSVSDCSSSSSSGGTNSATGSTITVSMMTTRSTLTMKTATKNTIKSGSKSKFPSLLSLFGSNKSEKSKSKKKSLGIWKKIKKALK
ncbi:hypothetical protein BGZ49_007860 [Haplosporangium sp. Z 27]|nr:hypothetical protein BGZ49_007860 [Haplosporangium sp. Z 27]